MKTVMLRTDTVVDVTEVDPRKYYGVITHGDDFKTKSFLAIMDSEIVLFSSRLHCHYRTRYPFITTITDIIKSGNTVIEFDTSEELFEWLIKGKV